MFSRTDSPKDPAEGEPEPKSVTEKREGLDKTSPEDRGDFIAPETIPDQAPEATEQPNHSSAEIFTSVQKGWRSPGRRW
ncbi:UNVERIFIED_ORG: hypothetical protein J2W16_004065 [Pseudomonas cremoricolorata]|nr:hypothetical protein [Pseudomonas cremoricolorata]